MQEILQSIPGIDEATSFGTIMKGLDQYKFDLIIFDTAPTGHTLRLLNFPKILEKAIVQLINMKEKFAGMLTSMSAMAQAGGADAKDPEKIHKKMYDSLDGIKTKIEAINT